MAISFHVDFRHWGSSDLPHPEYHETVSKEFFGKGGAFRK